MADPNNVFPAYAGMIPPKKTAYNAYKGVPRIRGDDPQRRAGRAVRRLVFPAYAGMIPERDVGSVQSYSVPRIRGDDPDTKVTAEGLPLCSPHTRG